MRLLNFIIIKLTLGLILGVALGYFIEIPFKVSLLTSILSTFLLLIFYIITKNRFTKTVWFGLLSFLVIINLGILTVNCHNQRNFKSHYSHLLPLNENSLKTTTLRIREVLKPGNYYNKYVVDVLSIEGKSTTGKSLLNIQKDSTSSYHNVDDIFVCKIEFKNLIAPLNPNQFDYKSYLDKKYIYHQIFINNSSLFKTIPNQTTILGIANNIRTYINKKLRPYNFHKDEISIINALLLGQRQDISKEIYSNYTNAGAIHILAISGLHIGIILLILNFIFKPIEQIKHGRLIKTVLLVLILWSFAIIAGLSASVTRAVTMFSIVAIGMNLKRPTNIFNTLAISILILLLIKPMFLFDVGFQLSYLAVFAIVIIDPMLYRLWKPKNKFLDYYWHTLTITISAQFGIIPISLYYFHQIPSLFFISNLVIIPFLGIILGLGILVILLAILNILPQFVADFYGYIISAMNHFVEWISQKNNFLIQNISFNLLYVICSYIFIIFLIIFWKRPNIRHFKQILLGIICIQLSVLITQYIKPANKFIIFHKSRYSLMANIQNNQLKISHDFDSLTLTKNTIVKDYMVGNHIYSLSQDSITNVQILNNKTLLIIDSIGAYNVKHFQPDYVLLRQSPKINLSRLIDSIKPKQIIADGSNYKSYIERWDAICRKRELPFHQTSKKGAYIINY